MRSIILGAIFGSALFAAAITNAGQRYLEPIEPYPPQATEYHQQVYRVLIGDRPSVLWMMGIVNSFGTERAVILRKIDAVDPDSANYELEYAVATMPIWRWKRVGDSAVMDYRTDGPIERCRTFLPDSTASTVIAIWKDVLQRTRYAETWEFGDDGEVYEFFAEPNMYGWVWSPDAGIPRIIADLGEMLGQYAQAKENQRPSHLRRILEIAEQLRLALDQKD
jgi:hypothetical protein